MHIQELQLLRSIKKTAVVLLLLFRLGRPVQIKEVAEMLDFAYDTARRHLRELFFLGLVVREPEGYTLAGINRWPFELIEITSDCAENRPIDVLLTTTTTAIGRTKESKAEVEERRLKNQEIRPISAKNLYSENAYSGGINPPFGAGADGCEPGFEPDEALVEALRDYGISLTPMVRSVLQAGEAVITKEYIHAHARRLQDERRFTTGLLLTVLRCQDPLPVTEEERRRRAYKTMAHY